MEAIFFVLKALVLIICIIALVKSIFIAKAYLDSRILSETNDKNCCKHTSWNYTTGKGRECNNCKSKI